MTGGGMVYDDVWAVDGTHVWMLVETIAGVSRMATLTYAAIEDARTDRAALELTGGDRWPRILGITAETENGHALVAIGDDCRFRAGLRRAGRHCHDPGRVRLVRRLGRGSAGLRSGLIRRLC